MVRIREENKKGTNRNDIGVIFPCWTEWRDEQTLKISVS